jgi:hypothetical protein
MWWSVDTTSPVISLVSPVNATVTRNSTVKVTVESSEPLSMMLVLQPGATAWTEAAVASTLVHTVMVAATNEGPHHTWLKGMRMIERELL